MSDMKDFGKQLTEANKRAAEAQLARYLNDPPATTEEILNAELSRLKSRETPPSIVTYTCKDTRPDSTCAGGGMGKEYKFWVFEGDDGTWGWEPFEDAWLSVGYPTRQAAWDAAEEHFNQLDAECNIPGI